MKRTLTIKKNLIGRGIIFLLSVLIFLNPTALYAMGSEVLAGMPRRLLSGTLSDYICRSKTQLISLFLYVVFALLLSQCHQYVSFLSLFTLLGLMAACYTSVGNAIIKDLSTNIGNSPFHWILV